jgi:hypothetical protein
MHVLLHDDQGRLALRRLWPWQRLLVGGAPARLDHALAEGASPEESASLAARATRLTSTEFRHDLAASLRRILVATGEPVLPVAARSPLGAARLVRVPLRSARIHRCAPLLAELANRLLEPGPVPVRGVAMVTEMLADGTGPLYRDAARDDLAVLAGRAADALAWERRLPA